MLKYFYGCVSYKHYIAKHKLCIVERVVNEVVIYVWWRRRAEENRKEKKTNVSWR